MNFVSLIHSDLEYLLVNCDHIGIWFDHFKFYLDFREALAEFILSVKPCIIGILTNRGFGSDH